MFWRVWSGNAEMSEAETRRPNEAMVESEVSMLREGCAGDEVVVLVDGDEVEESLASPLCRFVPLRKRCRATCRERGPTTLAPPSRVIRAPSL